MIIAQILVGLICGCLGVFIFSTLDVWDLFYSVMFTSIAGYLSMLAGVGIAGYSVLKKIGRQKDFVEILGFSFLGLISGILIYALIAGVAFNLLSYNLSSIILPIVLPLACTIFGFNMRLEKEKTTNPGIGDNDSTP